MAGPHRCLLQLRQRAADAAGMKPHTIRLQVPNDIVGPDLEQGAIRTQYSLSDMRRRQELDQRVSNIERTVPLNR